MDDLTPCAAIDTSHCGTTTRCSVRLGLSNGRFVDADVFLLSDPTRPDGVTTVEAILDGPREFLPVAIHGGNALLNRSSIRTVELPPEGPGVGDILEVGGTLDVVNLWLDSGQTLSGILRFPAPAETMRMSDVFNWPGRFLTISVGDRIVLVSKAHMVQASF